MNIYLDDSKCREALYPFTLTRHTADIRIGILTIREKWARITGTEIITTESNINPDTLVIRANIIPTLQNIDILLKASADKIAIMETEDIKILNYPWQIFQLNDWAIRADFKLVTMNAMSIKPADTNKVINASDIFIEEGAVVEHAVLNASAGPIHIGKHAHIMEGSLIRGPFSLGEHSVVKMGSRIYGATTIGPSCLAAGEIKNSVLFGYSNKAHDGYLGDSVVGEWCNLGAGTSNSNVKNTGGNIKYFLNNNMEMLSAGNKGGLLMGDYSRAAVNTTFNTGTVAGVCCNIFGDVSARKYIEDFSWGNDRYIFEKAIKDISNWKKMKQHDISVDEISMLRRLYDR